MVVLQSIVIVTCKTSSGAFVMGENNERIRIPEGAKVAVQADGTLYDEVTQNNVARLQTKTVDAEANNRLVQRENKKLYTSRRKYC